MYISLASLVQRGKESKNLNRNPETLAWRIPTAFISKEGRSARTETTATQEVLQHQACSFQCPKLALAPNSSCTHHSNSFASISQGWCNKLAVWAPRRGDEGGRTGTRGDQGTPRGAQPLRSGWHHRQEPQGKPPSQCWHRAKKCILC